MALLPKAKASAAHVCAERTPQFPSLDEVVRQIGEKMGTPCEALLAGRRGRRNLPRDLAIFVASRVAGFTRAEICHYFRLHHASVVSKVCERTAGLVEADPSLRQLIQWVTPSVELSQFKT